MIAGTTGSGKSELPQTIVVSLAAANRRAPSPAETRSEVRLARYVLGQPPRPGRCLLHTGHGELITVSVPRIKAVAVPDPPYAHWGWLARL